MWMLIFWILPLLAIIYIAWHVWTLLPLAGIWKSLIIFVGILCVVLLFMNFGRKFDNLPLPMAQAAYEIGTSSVIVLLYLVIIFLVLDLGRLAHLVPKTWLYHNGYVSLGVFLLIFGIFLYGNLHYYNKVRQPLELTSSKPLAKPVKMVLLSDLHLGYHNTRADFEKWVKLINDEKPDLVLMAGDIIDISHKPVMEENMAEVFRMMQAPVYTCLGNHDYYAGEPQSEQFIKESGIHLLRDESITLPNGITIIGRDDRTNMRRKSVKDLTKEADMSKFTILLDHQPYHLEDAERYGVDFQFSGHTHYGQVWPISWIEDRMYEDAFGPLQKGNTHYYVSSGIGIWGGKFRIGTHSEYVVLTLK